MIFGQREDFAIECYHEPISIEAGRVFGRICVWANNIQFGNINEPACILGTLQSEFSECLSGLPLLWDTEVDNLSDDDAFDGTNAFLLRSPTGFRILFRLRNNERGSASITRSGLVGAIEQFLSWMAAETPRGAIQ